MTRTLMTALALALSSMSCTYAGDDAGAAADATATAKEEVPRARRRADPWRCEEAPVVPVCG